MNILYYLRAHPLSSTFVLREINQLISFGHNVAVFAQTGYDSEIAKARSDDMDFFFHYQPATIRGLTGILNKNIISIKNLKRLITDGLSRYAIINLAQAGHGLDFVDSLNMDIDHIHSHFATKAQYPALMMSNVLEVPWTVTTHAYDLYSPPEVHYRDAVLNQADQLITISEYNKKYIKKDLQVDTPLSLIRAGINPAKFESKYETVPNRVITVASPVDKKGYETALRAIAHASKNVDDLEYRIIGWELEEQPHFERIIDELGIRDIVRCLGKVPDQRLKTEVDKAEVFLLPSQITDDGDRDGIPVAIMEAMALRTPPISTCVSGIPELIEHNQTGFLSNKTNWKSISGLMQNALATDLSTIQNNGREKIISEFNIRTECRKLEQVFVNSHYELKT